MAKQANEAAVERLKAAREKSLKLMQMDMNGSLGKIAESKRDSINAVVNGSSPNMVQEAQQMGAPNKNLMPMQQKKFGPAASKLPSQILEDFKQNPIGDDSQLMKEMFTGPQDVSFLTEGMTPAPKQQRQVVESAPQVIPSAGVDYPMIRTIVEEIVRKYAGGITKKVLNESKQANLSELNTLMIGKKFKFLANNGDIYECTMRKVSNVNDIKKGNV